ncbi:hypothetical protein S40293_07992 [Stachybotrys chartarum IBT 40293]|nr:hypothetical protein S40293_07992 [Stachybotrys chartarum IBT 40293]
MDKTPEAGAQANVHEIPVRLGKRHESPRSPTEIAENLRRLLVNARLLYRLVKRQNANLDVSIPTIDEEELAAITVLSGNVDRLLKEVTLICPVRKSDGHASSNKSNSNSPFITPSTEPNEVQQCHACGTTKTPRWRGGENQMELLCNVCGLLQRKRAVRKFWDASGSSKPCRWSGARRGRISRRGSSV